MRLAFLGDVTMDFFARDFAREGHDVYIAPGFGAWPQECFDSKSGLRRFAPEAVLLVSDRDDLVSEARKALDGAKILVPDIKALEREVPNFRDERMAAAAAFPFSLAGLKAIEDEFRWFIESLRGGPYKILAVDADNTLWRGIVSEDGPQAVVFDTVFMEGLKKLSAKGVLSVLLTKNDTPSGGDTPIERVFAREDSPLSIQFFTAAAIDWRPKAANLSAILKLLNLGADSVVFIDDNPHERRLMKESMPEVAVPPFEGAGRGETLVRRLETMFFPDAGLTREDMERAAGYRDEAVRRRDMAEALDIDDFLKSLKIWAEPSRATAQDVPRLAQMAGKTNQFNATTIRRDSDGFARLVSDPAARVWVFRCGDRYGEMGLVLYVVWQGGHITDFVMSCRAMGRTLEDFALEWVKGELEREGLPFEGIDYAPSAKNAPIGRWLSGEGRRQSFVSLKEGACHDRS